MKTRPERRDLLACYLADARPFTPPSPDEAAALAQRIQAGDSAAREALILGNWRLVVNRARRFATRRGTLDMLDLIQAGNVGLIIAAERFDPEQAQFSTYAIFWIDETIRREIHNHARTIRCSVAAMERLSQVKRATYRLERDLSREPSTEELATFLGLSVEQIRATQIYATVTSSMDQAITEDDGDSDWHDVVADSESAGPLDDVLSREALAETCLELREFFRVLALLPTRTQDLFKRRVKTYLADHRQSWYAAACVIYRHQPCWSLS